MDDFRIQDALTNNIISFDQLSGEATIMGNSEEAQEDSVESIFFPGCSFLNYALPLVAAAYDLLKKHEVVQGISVLCCGKILSYEPNGQVLRDAFEADLRDHVAKAGIKRMVCACPNCVKALREAFANDARTRDIELSVLPQVLADLGYRLDPKTCAALIKGNMDENVLLCTHDSCPDREYGDFARGLRALMPNDLWVDPAHAYNRSICCGSLPRAAGKFEQADRCAQKNGEEAQAVHADAIVTACMSCTFQLNMAQPYVQCVNYLELLFNWRVDWGSVGAWMKLRFLFNETLGAVEADDGGRTFAGLGDPCDTGDPTKADIESCIRAKDGRLDGEDEAAAQDVAFSNAQVKTIGDGEGAE